MRKIGEYWHTIEGDHLQCDLCPMGCKLEPGQAGVCGGRVNQGGQLIAAEYGRVVAAGVDPIEKKPLYHFHPGAPILSIAAHGCNLQCKFCQNWSISQSHDGAVREVEPGWVVAEAERVDSIGIAYTYSEPLVWYEFVHETSALARERGLKNVLVSNGFLNEAPLRQLLPLIDAANFDLKSMDDAFYRKICLARVQPVLDAIRLARELGVHVEVTNLVIPGHNDSDEQLQRLIDFVAGLDRDVPLHFSAYHPSYLFDAPPTPVETLRRAADLARRKLDFVYVGNVTVPDGSNTRCPGCGNVVVERAGYFARSRLTPDAHCPDCGRELPFVLD